MHFLVSSYLFADAIRAPAEALSGRRQVVGFVLEAIDVFSTFPDFGDIAVHDIDRVLDLLPEKSKS